jgi:nitroreductase
MTDYEGLLELMKARRSVRRFLDRPVSHETIEKLVEAARWAPSNHNRQGWKFLVFEDRERIRELARQARKRLAEKLSGASPLLSQHAHETVQHATLFEGAPCVMLVMHKRPTAVSGEATAGLESPDLVSGEPLSAAMAVQNMLLAASALGLGACVMTAPLLAGEVFEAIPDLPAGLVPTCLVAVGYPADSPPAPRRKRLEQILEYR